MKKPKVEPELGVGSTIVKPKTKVNPIPIMSINQILALVPKPKSGLLNAPISAGIRRRLVKHQNLLPGKGKYGKRPATFSVDYGHSSNDNSNDSGLECDNSNSDSQFWESAGDLRTVGISRTGGASMVSGDRQLLPQLLVSSGKDLSTVEDRKPRSIFGNSEASPILVHPVAVVSNPPIIRRGTKQVTAASEPETMPSGSTPVKTDYIMAQAEEKKPSTLSLGAGVLSRISSSVPVKRSRFNFQTPVIPLKSANALRLRNQNQSNGSSVRRGFGKRLPAGTPPTLSTSVMASSRDGRIQLQILAQPEEQHRARYQTEGSRGAIKDRKGNGFPAVKLVGYDKPATLQIFIGSDQGKVSPHMFYQACKVTGKSSTPCIEKKVEGTILIEIEFEQSKEMVITCDCVGILKERNVDVEQRFPFYHAATSRKKSTRCRLIFRTTIINYDGVPETLQVSSLPILCTQPPGQPEICKKSLSECFARGGQELFIVGKNFLKDTKVVVQEENADGELLWESKAEVLKDYLQQNHLICVLPPYKEENILKPVCCRVAVWSGGKMSDPHNLTYLPNNGNVYYGVPATSCVSPIDTHAPPQGLAQNGLQQQLNQTMLSVDMPMGDGSLLNGSEAVVPNSFMSDPGAALIGQISELNQTPATTTTISTLNFENSMMAPPASQQERLVVSELQEILDHSSQQTMMSMNETKPTVLPSAPTSFFGLNVVGGMPMEVPSTFQQSNPSSQTSPSSQPTSSPSALFSEMSQHQDLSTRQPTSDQFGDTSTVTACTIPQVMSMVQQPIDSQILCSSTTAETIMNCMTQSMKPEVRPSSEPGGASCVHQQAQTAPRLTNVIGLMGGELQGDQGSIANALTQMSDNELLNYINPNCFEQA